MSTPATELLDAVKAALEDGRVMMFATSNPEEQKRLLFAPAAFSVLHDLDQWLREKIKYGNEPTVTPESVREKLWELLSEEEIPQELV